MAAVSRGRRQPRRDRGIPQARLPTAPRSPRPSRRRGRPDPLPTSDSPSKWATNWATHRVQTDTNHRACDHTRDPSHQTGKHGTGRKAEKTRRELLIPRSKVRSLHGPSACALQWPHFRSMAHTAFRRLGNKMGNTPTLPLPRADLGSPIHAPGFGRRETVREGCHFPFGPFVVERLVHVPRLRR